MNYKSTFLPKARDEVKETYIWYEKQNQGLGKRFTSSLKQKVTEIK